MKHICALAAIIAISPFSGAAASDEDCSGLVGRGPLLCRMENLAFAKQALEADEKALKPARDALVKRAEDTLETKPYSVTGKSTPPPGGDLHDYWSLAPYWWPDPKKPDGLPYVRKDGETNPARNSADFDRIRLSDMTNDVVDLSLAAYFTGDVRHAAHAELMLKTWFLDEATKMRPALKFAHDIPGQSFGRPIGIIDTIEFAPVVDSVLLLEKAGMIWPAIVEGTRGWFGEYSTWLVTDKLGLEERAANNNHGTFYDAQAKHFAPFALDFPLAARISADAPIRIASQINSSGQMPLELERTRSLHYTAFNLDAFMMIARLAAVRGENLWTHEARNGGSILKAIHFVARFAVQHSKWRFKELKSESASEGVWMSLRTALTALADEEPANSERGAVNKDPSELIMLTTWTG